MIKSIDINLLCIFVKISTSLWNHCKKITIITGMPVPIAIIVCEGDINTITEITQALEHKLPVIIMKGSGKAVDLVLDSIDKYSYLY